MDTRSNYNTCAILHQREMQQNSVSSYKLISNRFDRKTEHLFKRDLLAHFGCVNAVEFSNNGQFLVSGGDDRRVLLWNVQKALHNCGKPFIMSSEHHSNIFCLSFDNSVKHIYSAGNDDQVILHDIETGKAMDVFNLEHPVYGISVDPCNDNIFASAGEDGRILIFDTRLETGSDPYLLAHYRSAFHSVMFNPIDPRLITTANSKEGAALWDIRVASKVLLQYGRKGSCMNVRWDQTGTRILALRRRQTPVLYQYDQPRHIVQFSHENYYNSCTMKSCCFAGLKDEYVLSGSDDFNLYMWKIEDAMSVDQSSNVNNVHQILKGHRSIVNQVRFDPYNCIIASSGVEKLIKVWSPVPVPYCSTESNWIRARYTHDEYISLLLRSGQFMSHDYSEQSTSEDPQMMAFFDSLVQREREGLASHSDDTSDDDVLCSDIESLDDTDYSSLSDDSAVPDEDSTRTTSAACPNGNVRSRPRLPVPSNANSADEDDDDERLQSYRSKFRSYFEDKQKSASSSSSQSQGLPVSPSQSLSSTSSSTTSPSSSSLSSNSEEEKRNRTPKRKIKSKLKEALQRLKRVRSSVQSSSADSPSDRSSTLETCPSSGGTSTDTVDSGVCLYSSPTPPRIKFSSFKRNEKRKYRSRRSLSSSSSSSSNSE